MTVQRLVDFLLKKERQTYVDVDGQAETKEEGKREREREGEHSMGIFQDTPHPSLATVTHWYISGMHHSVRLR